MLESVSDFLSVAVAAFLAVYGIRLLILAAEMDRERTFRRAEARYYRFYEDTDDGLDDDEKNETYFED
ncbi:MAG: hypothetical protein K6D03_11350 [Solobacterium sp.]|nr:hypothetical protein [Solobacterium sp.]